TTPARVSRAAPTRSSGATGALGTKGAGELPYGAVVAEQPVMVIGAPAVACSPAWLTNVAFTGSVPHVAGVSSSARGPPSRASVNVVARKFGRLSKTVSMLPSLRRVE